MLTPADLEVHVFWANAHLWRAGQRHSQPRIGGHSLWIIQEGRVVVTDESGQHQLSRGQALLWPASRARTVCAPEGANWMSVGLRVTALGQLDLLERLDLPRQWTPIHPETILEPMQGMIRHRKPRDGIESLLLDALARTVFLRTWTELRGGDLDKSLEEKLPSWMSAALQAGRESPDVNVAELARAAGISPAHLRREFNRHYGQPPHVFLARQRLETARRLLENSDLPVRAVAGRAGYASVSHFSRVFKTAFGVPPDAYRRSQETGI
jgi:AraC-like DNA-binding protein